MSANKDSKKNVYPSGSRFSVIGVREKAYFLKNYVNFLHNSVTKCGQLLFIRQ